VLDEGQDALEFVGERMRQGRLDLQRAPLMRVEVVSDPHNTHCYALLQIHHIVDDATSLKILVSEAVAHLQGHAHLLPDSVPYREHVAHALACTSTQDTESFFRTKLEGLDEPTAPFGLLEVREAEEAQEELRPELARRVRVQARRLCVSTATLLHAAWGLVVARTSGRDDVVFGSVLLGRLQGSAGAQRVMGMFINTLPLRLDLRAVTARQLVEQTQRELVELLDHEQASLGTAQRSSSLGGTAPLFSALLNYRHSLQDRGEDWSDAPGIHELETQDRTHYPIVLSVDDLGEGITLVAQTDTRIAASRLIGYVTAALQSLCEALETTPERAALSLSVVPEGERRQLIERFNGAPQEYPQADLIHELFERQADRAPDAIAVSYEGRSLTYGELNERANRLAHYLIAQGVGPDRLVGICVERSLEMVVGLLGILKAGGAYLPLDPGIPVERLQYLLQDADPKVLLTQSQIRSRVGTPGAQVIELDAHWGEIERHPHGNPRAIELGVRAEHLAYVIYTSGSTGQPKGVQIEHRQVTRLFAATQKWFDFCAQDVWTMFHSFAFDFSVWELWGGLSYGGRVVVVPQPMARSPQDFYRLLCEEGVTVLNQTPSAFAQLIEAQTPEAPRHALRVAIFGGEALELHTLRPWVARNGVRQPRLVNMYGITETTVHVTYRELSEQEIQAEGGGSPIGRAIDDLRVYVLDGSGEPAPLGVAGELYVGGAGVARGYLNRPELTAERFVRDPFNGNGRGRMYKSGDLGRWRADGTLEYLGRNDQQVKIRGYRIELGEIEAASATHPGVQQAVVLAREDEPGEKRLVAYVVPAGGGSEAPTADLLRAHLKSRLPEYMVPAAYVLMEKLPLTANGKLNRRALPAPQQSAYTNRQYQAPQSELEEALAGIWQEVLSVERVGRQDHFFELGGHSLLALQLLVKIHQTLGQGLTVTDIYKSPTLRELAERIMAGAAAEELVDLAKESQLDAELAAQRTECRRVPERALLVTGCTGFVGRFLLAQLLQETDATLYCLVRPQATQQARVRLRAALRKWDLWTPEAERRVVAVPADLSRPKLGLRDGVYEVLAESVDSVYHCATSMNHLETYAMAKAANVEATRDLLKFATQGRPKLINYISTLSVFGEAPGGVARLVTEDTPVDRERHLTSHGYAASKWVSEKMLITAAERGIACNIFRLGLVWADAQHGRYDELQREYRLIKSCLSAGVGIEDYGYGMAPLPVDYVARAILALARQSPRGGGIYHLASCEQPAGGLFERCNELAEVSLDLLPQYEWIGAIKRLHDAGVPLPVVPLIEFAFPMTEAAFDEYCREADSPGTRFDCSRTLRALEQAGMAAPRWSVDLLEKCVVGMISRDAELQRLLETQSRTARRKYA